MSKTHSVGPQGPAPLVQIILGTLSSDLDGACHAASAFAEPHGGIALWGEPVPFDATSYYTSEMGPGLVRRFCCCNQLIEPEGLVELKLRSWSLEQTHQRNGSRRINLDPGIIDYGKVVLASFKAAPQKLYLGQSVWADTLLFFSNGGFTALPWTFPDLRHGAHVDFFERARARYCQALRARHRSAD